MTDKACMRQITRTQFLLALHSVPHLGPRGIARLIADMPAGLPDELLNLADVRGWSQTADNLQKEYKLHPKASEFLATQKDALISDSSKLADAVKRHGIRVISMLDADYSCSLREYETEPPPIIYAYGNMSLLRERKFAVVSSSETSGKGLEIVRELAGTLSEEGLAVVTSHNTHPYKVAGLAAKSRKSPVILVLDRGIISAFPQGLGFEPVAQARIWDLKFDPERDLVISKFRLYDPWIGANGKERDRMVFGLADVVVAVEVRPGGVMESECLHAYEKGREIYVYKPDDGKIAGGNLTLLDKGCPQIPAKWAYSQLRTLDMPAEQTDDLEEIF